MKKILYFLAITVLTLVNSFGQNSLWTKTSDGRIGSIIKMERASSPVKYELYSLDLTSFKLQLQNAPLETINGLSNLIITMPNPKGELDNYRIYESPIMEKGLSDKFPDIKTYVGQGVDNKLLTIRFSITLFGLHCMSFSGDNGTYYIDTYTKDLQNYIVYNRLDVTSNSSFSCLVKGLNKNALDNNNIQNESILRSSDGNFRIFRLAMACTIEYASYHIIAAGLSSGSLIQKKAAVLAAMVVTMNRVNGIYERDMSLRMNLVANNDLLIFVTSDTFSNTDPYALIDESQVQITNIIGSANFDIGHTVSTGGGGLAGPSPCVNNSKASGITGSDAPVGDPYNIDYVAHEMGHQFGANHTFNSGSNNCGGQNRNAETAVEPGSGSSIMAYAGICSPQDVQPNSDALLHAISIAEMVSLIINEANCANTTANGNTPPVVNAGLDYTIPKSTAYVLKGTATDSNGDSLTYCWEQINPGVSTTLATATTTSSVPNYRSRLPNSSPNRYMPVLSSVIAGNLTPAWEITPSVARTFAFALTVRDNRVPLGGQTKRDDINVTVNGTAGPFTVTSQNTTGVIYAGNTDRVFTWNVAGTTANNVNTANVKISLSTDNGLTFPVVLSASTPNDGTETITIPGNINSVNCRVMIEAVGNIFYAVNSQKFTITPSLKSDSFGLTDFSLYPNPNNGTFAIKFNSNTSTSIAIVVNDIRGREIYSKSIINTGLINQVVQLNNLQSGVYIVTVQDGDKKEIKRIIIN